MEQQVLLTIVSSQRFMSEEAEETKLVTEGIMQLTDERIEISYAETELTGLVGTRTSFCIEKDRVSLKRSGSVESVMTFMPGHEDHSLYDMGFGALMITIRTERIACDIGHNGGTLQVAYGIVIEDETAGFIEYRIDVKVK
ncbi:MAG: DUF1934 domain-containing protein [Ruminococcaceae bacterium]|nr:DUF1934 domain-containing protein [Oscillospiraceae bacterium]